MGRMPRRRSLLALLVVAILAIAAVVTLGDRAGVRIGGIGAGEERAGESEAPLSAEALREARNLGLQVAAASPTVTGGSGRSAPGKKVVIQTTARPVPPPAPTTREAVESEIAPLTPPDPSAPVRRAPPLAGPTTPAQPDTSGANVPGAAGTFTFFQTTALNGGNTSEIAEPSVGTDGASILETYNWYAAKSDDGGRTFSYMSPYTGFATPAGAGGFCCDQLALYDPGRDLFIWVLQYSKDSSGHNVVRIAVANGRNELAGGSASFTYWDFVTAASVGAPNDWFDQPKIATTANSLYLEISRYNQATPNNQWQGSHVFSMPLSELAAGGTVNYQFLNTNVFSPGLAVGSGANMYFAAHVNSSTLRVWTWPDNTPWQSASSVDVAHTSYPANYPYTCPRSGGPASADFCQRMSDRIFPGWFSGGVVGWAWGGSQGASGMGTYNYPQVQWITLNASTKAVLAQRSIWNSTAAWGHASIAANQAGDLGGVFVFGGGSTTAGSGYENCVAGIDDGYTTGAAFETVFATSSTVDAGTGSGDYQTVRANGGNAVTWSGGCYGLPGASRPYFVSFGREGNTPLRTLTVSRTGTGSGTVTSAPSGISCGATCSSRFVQAQTVRLTASSSPGSQFVGWSGACSGIGSCDVSMGTDRSVTAQFDAASSPPSIPNLSVVARPFTVATTAAVSWSATSSGVTGYDLRVRTAPYNAGSTGYGSVLSNTASTSYTAPLPALGTTYCFGVQARNASAQASGFSGDVCTAVPVDDAALGIGAGRWTRTTTTASAFRRTLTKTSAGGATLVLPNVTARALAIVGVRCSTCGTVRVLFNGTPIGDLSMAGAKKNKNVFLLPPLPAVQTGTVTIQALTSGKPISIDGLGVSAV